MSEYWPTAVDQNCAKKWQFPNLNKTGLCYKIQFPWPYFNHVYMYIYIYITTTDFLTSTYCRLLWYFNGNELNNLVSYKYIIQVTRWIIITHPSWWRHQMETFSTLLAICVGNSPVTGEFPTLRPVTWSFGVFFDLRLNKRLSKQSWGWWFETPFALIMMSL